MVVDDVVAAFSNHKRLSLEVRTSELIKKRHYLLDAVLRPGERMMPGNSPYDVVRHHGLHGGHVFARVAAHSAWPLSKSLIPPPHGSTALHCLHDQPSPPHPPPPPPRP